MRIKKNQKGFTLIELLIVVAIIAILAAIAIPQFAAYRMRGYNGASQSDLRNGKTVQESVMAEYRGYGSSQGEAVPSTLVALAVPAANGEILIGPNIPATGSDQGSAIVTMTDTDGDAALEQQVGLGMSVSNNVSVDVDVQDATATQNVGFLNYRMRSKHRDGSRAFSTNVSPAVCYSENLLNAADGGYVGAAMVDAALPTPLAAYAATCGGQVSDGNPVATWAPL